MTAHAEVPDFDGAGAGDGDGAGDRPLRRDAERNRRRILAAAAGLLSERGLDVTLDDVARAAGVGVGTVYRRFPDKEALIEELFRDRVDALVELAEQALTEPDPWQAFVSYLETATEMMAANLGLRQLMMYATYGKDRICYARDQMRPVVSRLVERAQAAGDLRQDFDATDVKLIAYMLGAAAEYAAHSRPEIWRRYLAMLIDGLRPSRPSVTALPVPPLTAEDLATAMGAHGRRPALRR
jgi:AcrR family transcriptional regulator